MPVKLTIKIIEELEPGSGIVWDATFAGLGVRPGKKGAMFIYEGRVRGERIKKKLKIGAYGAVVDAQGEPCKPWTIGRARTAAGVLKGQLAKGIDPNVKPEKTGGPTLRDALDLHLSNMEKKKRAPRSIATIRGGIEKHLKAWLDRPISDLTSRELCRIHDDIIANTAARDGAVNTAGHASAKRVVINVGTCWTSLNKQQQGELGNWNPAKGVETYSLKARDARISGDDDAPEWYRRVQTLCGVRRDIQLLALFTGIRADGLINLRWSDIDDKAGTITVRIAKGGRPYSVPLCKTHREILARRRAENPKLELFDGYQGDDGWIFPTRTRAKPFAVTHTQEPKEWRVVKGKRSRFLPGLHPLRRTYSSVAAEIGIAEIDVKIMLNHKLAGVTGKHYTKIEDRKRFAKVQASIERALWELLIPDAEERAKSA